MSELLPAVEISSTGPARAAVVWLHGLGADGHDFVPAVPLLQMPWCRFVLPHAPSRPVTINGGYVMPAWFDLKTLDRSPHAEREDAAQVRVSAAQVHALIDREVARGVPPAHVAVVGFSQGAGLAVYAGLRYPSALGAIAALSGMPLLPAAAAEQHPANAQTPLFCAHGTVDDVVPLDVGRALVDLVSSPQRLVLRREYPMGHSVCEEELGELGAFLRRNLGA